MKAFQIALGVGLTGLVVLAGPAAAKSAGVDPRLPKEVQDMYCLVGEWRADFKFRAGAEQADVKLALSCNPTSNGYGIACKARFTGFPSGQHEETDLFGFDPGAGKYHWFSVTSMGETHDHVADPPNGDTLRWVYTGVSEGKAMVETATMKFSQDSRRIEFRNDGTVGGKPAWSLVGTLHKK